MGRESLSAAEEASGKGKGESNIADNEGREGQIAGSEVRIGREIINFILSQSRF